MDTVLIDEWLGGQESLPVLDEASVSVVRERVRAAGAGRSFSDAALGSIVNVASELAHNQLAHARGGRVAVRSIERSGVPGIEVIAADRGDGIAAPTEALRTTRPPPQAGVRKSLGSGLAAVLELADEVDFDVRVGEGSCVWARKFAASVPRRRQVALYGRACSGEEISGDHGGFVRADDAVLVGVVDGLGHGPPAREASDAAVETMLRGEALGLDRLLEDCHDALRDTRGAVMGVARISEPGDAMQAAAVGNITLHLYRPGSQHHMAGSSFVLGSSGRRPKISIEENLLGLRDVVVLFSDGVSGRADVGEELDLLREHPIIIAHQIVERFARDNDDALVLVAR